MNKVKEYGATATSDSLLKITLIALIITIKVSGFLADLMLRGPFIPQPAPQHNVKRHRPLQRPSTTCR